MYGSHQLIYRTYRNDVQYATGSMLSTSMHTSKMEAISVAAAREENICGASYMQHHFAHDQQKLRSENRFLVVCSESSGLGAYLKGLVSAVYLSIFTERAILLQGCIEPHDGGQIENYIHEYFQGRSFGWHNHNHTVQVNKVYRVDVGRCGWPCEYNRFANAPYPWLLPRSTAQSPPSARLQDPCRVYADFT